jgi:hypothetical protein
MTQRREFLKVGALVSAFGLAWSSRAVAGGLTGFPWKVNGVDRYRCGSTGSPNFDTVSVDAHLAA